MGKKDLDSGDEDAGSNDKKRVKRKRLDRSQVHELESSFQKDIYPTTDMKEELAAKLNLDINTVSKWFINRRVKLRNVINPKEGESDKESTKSEGKDPPKKLVITIGPTHPTSPGGSQSNSPPSSPTQTSNTITPSSSTVVSKNVNSQSVTTTTPPAITNPPSSEERPRQKRKSSHKEEKQFWKEYKEKNLKDGEEEGGSTKSRKWNDSSDDEFSIRSATQRNRAQENVPRRGRRRKTERRIEGPINGEESEFRANLILAADGIPLWRQLYHYYGSNMSPTPVDPQAVLTHIYNTRIAQKLPPVFAMISGPTILPYRMEELEVIIGRNSAAHKEADIHLGDHKKISHLHAKIYFDKDEMCFKLLNLSKNGIKLKKEDDWIEYKETLSAISLPNPATFDIQGIPVYFQIFYIGPTPESVPSEPTNGHTAKRGRPTRNAKSYVGMIEEALKHHGGQATYKEIIDYISKHCKRDIEIRRTWKNSVGGVLSSHNLFEYVASADSSKDGKRSRGSLWRLRDPASIKEDLVNGNKEINTTSNGKSSTITVPPMEISAKDIAQENTSESIDQGEMSDDNDGVSFMSRNLLSNPVDDDEEEEEEDEEDIDDDEIATYRYHPEETMKEDGLILDFEEDDQFVDSIFDPSVF